MGISIYFIYIFIFICKIKRFNKYLTILFTATTAAATRKIFLKLV